MHGTPFNQPPPQRAQQQLTRTASQLQATQQEQHSQNGGMANGSTWHAPPKHSPASTTDAELLLLPDVAPFEDNPSLETANNQFNAKGRRKRKPRDGTGRAGMRGLHTHKHKHRKHKHRGRHSAHNGDHSSKHSTHHTHRKQRKTSHKDHSKHHTTTAPQPAAETQQTAQEEPQTRPVSPASASSLSSSAVIEQWVRSWGSSSMAGESIVVSKVADKVKKEWDSKDRTGVELHKWLTANPKRTQQARALLTLYEKKQRRRADNNGSQLEQSIQ